MLGWEAPLTHRQFRLWQMWRDLQWNRPNRTDYYLMAVQMQIAGVANMFAKHQRSFRLRDFRINFETQRSAAPPKMLTVEEAAFQAKARMFSMIPGVKIKGLPGGMTTTEFLRKEQERIRAKKEETDES